MIDFIIVALFGMIAGYLMHEVRDMIDERKEDALD